MLSTWLRGSSGRNALSDLVPLPQRRERARLKRVLGLLLLTWPIPILADWSLLECRPLGLVLYIHANAVRSGRCPVPFDFFSLRQLPPDVMCGILDFDTAYCADDTSLFSNNRTGRYMNFLR